MKNGYKKTYIYLIVYVAIMLIKYIFIYELIDINPMAINISYYKHIYSMDKQILLYTALFFSVGVLFTAIKRVFITEISVCYMIIIINLWIYTVISCLSFEEIDILDGIVMLIYMKCMMKHLKQTYPKISLVQNLRKYKIVNVILILLLLIALNVVYVVMPRDTLYVYREFDLGSLYTYETNNNIVTEVESIEIDEFLVINGEIYANGWMFKAKEAGTETIYIRDEYRGANDIIAEVKINIGEDLKFHNVLTMEYVVLFYPLNVLIICYCVMYIILVVISKVDDVISKKQNSKADVTI